MKKEKVITCQKFLEITYFSMMQIQWNFSFVVPVCNVKKIQLMMWFLVASASPKGGKTGSPSVSNILINNFQILKWITLQAVDYRLVKWPKLTIHKKENCNFSNFTWGSYHMKCVIDLPSNFISGIVIDCLSIVPWGLSSWKIC